MKCFLALFLILFEQKPRLSPVHLEVNSLTALPLSYIILYKELRKMGILLLKVQDP